MLNYLLHTANAIVAVPVLVLIAQILLSLKKDKSRKIAAIPENLSVLILVPAHNEEAVIANTLLPLKEQLTGKDSVLVIADNCTDDTASIVRQHGIEVVTRENSIELGKGYALGFGINQVKKTGASPDVLVILDADCTITDGSLRCLAAICLELNRPAQALYRMHSNEQKGVGQKVAEFAWMVKSSLRPAAYKRLGLPCQLKGTGMAFPWSIVDADKFNSANIVEDLELGIQYTLEGYPPFFYSDVTVSSFFPTDSEGEKSQRKRWEQGHLVTSVKLLPKLILKSIKNLDLNCAALAADLLVPPLALLSILLIMLNIICLLSALTEVGMAPFLVSFSLFSIFSFGILVAWYYFGREIIGVKDLLYIPIYVLRKVPMYVGILLNRQVRWIKTPRDKQRNPDNH